MAKTIGKYFIAIVPEGDIQSEAKALKLEMQKRFNLKYALKSPAHITLKMPFNWNENKEEVLIHKLDGFFKNFQPLVLELCNLGRFGKRVIFINVTESEILHSLQTALKQYCKTNLNLVTELSDSAYHPHMTVAFKDIKEKRFQEYWDFAQTLKFDKSLQVQKIALLKRIEGRWKVIFSFVLNNGEIKC